MILALLALGLPCCIMLLFLWECHQHHRELERAERDLADPPPNSSTKTTRPNFFGRLAARLRRKN